jgi:hypothetical protein
VAVTPLTPTLALWGAEEHHQDVIQRSYTPELERKDVISIGDQLVMKPTSEQTRNVTHSVIPFLTEDLLAMRSSFFRYTTESSDAALRPAAVDSSSYGCVDWYIYPLTKSLSGS